MIERVPLREQFSGCLKFVGHLVALVLSSIVIWVLLFFGLMLVGEIFFSSTDGMELVVWGYIVMFLGWIPGPILYIFYYAWKWYRE